MKGGTTFAALKAKFDSDIEGASSPFTNGDSIFNVKKSYTRCQEFLKNYRYFLRKTKAETDANATEYLDHYTNSASLYSLRPVPIERSFSSIPELPAITYSVKYTTNPNLQYGYESNENVKVSKEGAFINCTHSFDVKSINSKSEDLNSFEIGFGTSSAGIINFQTFTVKAAERSKQFVHDLMNGSQTINFKNLKPDPSIQIALALIKKSSKIPRRGKDFNLSLEYSSDNKYAPLWFNQRGSAAQTNMPSRDLMFNNLVIPASLHQILADNFTFFDKKVNVNAPVEKFTERIVLGRPQGVSIIDPSVTSSTGKMKISFTGKINKNQISAIAAVANVHGAIAAGALDNFFQNGSTSNVINFLNKILNIRNMFFGSGASFAPIFHATVTSEIQKLIDDTGTIHPINGYAPTSISYSFNSDFDFSIDAEVEFYSKSTRSKRKPIFGFKGNKKYNAIDTKAIFNQSGSF